MFITKQPFIEMEKPNKLIIWGPWPEKELTKAICVKWVTSKGFSMIREGPKFVRKQGF